MDLLIAISAKAAGLPLLTRDLKHFDRIPSLVVETY
jgi:predicted nucleic acid-binding protein